MKNFKQNFKSIVQSKARWLLTLIAILTLGVGQMWATTTYYLKCNSTNWSTSSNYDYPINSNGTVNVCMKSTYEEFKFYHYDWGVNSWMGGDGTLKPGDAGRTFYQKGASTYYNGNKGYVTFHMQDNGDYKDWQPWVWITRPKWYLKHNWNQGSWTWYELNDNNDGTYWVDGQYGAQTTVNHGPSSSDAGSGWGEITATTVGSPVKGTNCRFKYDAVAGTVTITRLCKITYDKNDAGSGSAPAAQYVLYNTATATYTNTEGMTKTNMAFIGWNERADGTGTHYDAGENITLTADKTLYAEWVPCWVLRGGNSDKSDGTDAMGDWTPQEMTIIGTNAFMIELNLAASTTYQFKIVDRHNGKKADYSTWTHYGNNGTMTGTTLDWTFSSSDGNCKLSTGADGAGTWRFAWNASSKVLCVYKKDDATKSSFAQGKYIYFDARTETDWKENPFNAKFYFKNLATGEDDGDITCNNTAKLDDWVYYALVPAEKTWGAVQMNNLNTSDGFFRYDANTIYARGRSSANQNCMVTPSSGERGITLSWGTYCPPIKSATLADNSTVTYGGNGSKANPYLVEKGGTIKLQAHTTKYIDDDNMTPMFLFFDAATQKANQTDSAYDYTASANADVIHKMVVKPYNRYNSTNSTQNTKSDTLFYQTVTCYNVTYSAPTNGDYTISVAGGSASSETKKAIAGQTITLSATPVNQAYTFKAWTVTNTSTSADVTATLLPSSSTTASTSFTMPAYNVSITANFALRFGLEGSLMNDDAAGMPGWQHKDAADFTVESFTGLGASGVDLRCSRTLEPNKEYKFRIYDRERGDRLGVATSDYLLEANNSVELSTVGDVSGKNVLINTVGYGTYTFKITAISAEGYPTITVLRQASYQSNFDTYYTDGSGTLHQGTTGGTISVQSTEGGNNYTLASGNYVAAGGSITYTATPEPGYDFVGWFGSSVCTGEPFNKNLSWTDSPLAATSNSYAKFVPATLTFKKDAADTDWFDKNNWSPACVPTIDHDVVIERSCWIQANNAKAKSVEIHNYGDGENGGYLYIYSGWSYTGGLVVANGITAVHSEGDDPEATTKDDLFIDTDERGNGGLICGSASANTNAKYYFYTKARKYNYSSSSYYINQYVGIPFASMPADQIYGFNIFVYDADADDWRTPSGEGANTMQPWTAYNLIRQYSNTDWNRFTLNGTLNLPGIDGDGRLKTLTCSSKTNRVSTGEGTSDVGNEFFDSKGDYMFANSWTAPISIKDLQTSDISDLNGDDEPDIVPIIYIFNAGFDGASSKGVGTYAGTWTPFPFSSSAYMDNAVIPATQAFLVSAKVPNATLTLDYKKHVYDPAISAGQINTYPTRAPRRSKTTTDDPTKLKIVANCDSTEADNLYIFERGDFSEGYDEGWDGGKLVDYAYSFAPQLYAIHGVNKLGVDAVKEMDGTNLGFKAGKQANEYTLTFEYNDEEPLYLYDKETNAYTEITNEATYEFTTTDTKAHERFLLTRSNAPQIATGVEEIDTENIQRAQKFMQDQQIFIRRGDRVYNVTGFLVK